MVKLFSKSLRVVGRSLPVANALRRPNRQVRPAPHGLKGRSATKKSADRGRRPRFCGRLPSYGTFSTDWGAPLGAPFYICGKERKKSLDGRGVMCYNKSRRKMRGCSSMVEPQPSKLVVWVRFPSPAPGVAPRACRGEVRGGPCLGYPRLQARHVQRFSVVCF